MAANVNKRVKKKTRKSRWFYELSGTFRAIWRELFKNYFLAVAFPFFVLFFPPFDVARNNIIILFDSCVGGERKGRKSCLKRDAMDPSVMILRVVHVIQ